jgi:hypothetical protein
MRRRRGAAGQIVPPRSLDGELVRFVVDRVVGLWRWRELTLPLATLYLAYWFAGSYAATWVAAVLVYVLAPVALVRPSLVSRVPRRCIARTRWHRRRRRWPRVCVGLHWYRKLDHEALLIPELLSWREERERISIAFRPLAEHAASSWDGMADALRRFVGGASVEWRESYGTLRIVVGRVGLPDHLSWQAHGAPEGRLVLGRRHGGGELAIDSRTTPHVLLAGATGSGKGGAIRAAAAAALQAGWHVVVLDPKEAGEYAWLHSLGVPVVTELREQVDTLERLAEIRRVRQEVVRGEGLDSWYELPSERLEIHRPVLLVVDEAADLLAATKGKSGEDRLRANFQHKAGELIAELARKGRSAAIHLLVAIQRPETAQLGEQGGALRNNLTARLALGSLDADGLRMLGISSSDPAALALDGTPGRGICVGFAGDPRPSVCQVAWLDQQRARAEVTPAYLQGLQLIGPMSANVLLAEGA